MSDEILPPGRSRETTIRRDAQGRWWHEGEPVENEQVAQAFHRWVDSGPDGRYVLKNGVNWGYVVIEGAPFFVTALREEQGRLQLRLSDGTEEPLDEETLRQDAAGVLYCDVKERTMAASFSRSAMYALEPWVDEEGLTVGGRRLAPPTESSPLRYAPPLRPQTPTEA